MESLAAVLMVLATAGVLGVFVLGARGYRLPPRLFARRTWARAAAWTAAVGTAATLGAALAGTGDLPGILLSTTIFLLAVEAALWFDARTFGPR